MKELWLVTPHPALLEVLVLDGETYRLVAAYAADETLRSPSFPDLTIRLEAVFSPPIEPDDEVLLVKEDPAPWDAAGRGTGAAGV